MEKYGISELELSGISSVRYVIERNEYEVFVLIQKKGLIELSETSHFLSLIRFGMGNKERFKEYFFMPEIDFYKEYILFCVQLNYCLNLDKYDSPWPESSVAYFCQEILKALNYLDEHQICYGSQKFCVNSMGQVKLNFHQTVYEHYHAFLRRDGDMPYMAPSLLLKCIDVRASIRSDVYALGIQAMVLLENALPQKYANEPNKLKYCWSIASRPVGSHSLRETFNFKPETRQFVQRSTHLKSSKRAKLIELMNHEYLKLADSAEEFKEGILSALLKAQ